jgi:signal transduction histidine kinase
VKFSPQGGSISLAAACVAGDLQVTVSDQGPRIPVEHRPHIFDRYWHSRQGNRRGTGLGLCIAKGIVEAHRGRIWIEDNAPGTTVAFTLPLHA